MRIWLEPRLKRTLFVLFKCRSESFDLAQNVDGCGLAYAARTDDGDEFCHFCIVLRELF